MTGEDDSSDWDRFSDDGNETTSSTALSDGSGPASQVARPSCSPEAAVLAALSHFAPLGPCRTFPFRDMEQRQKWAYAACHTGDESAPCQALLMSEKGVWVCKCSFYLLQGGQDNAIRRPREHSLFGVAEKRAPAPFRYLHQHAKLEKAATALMNMSP